jgi:hypothetical protein
MSTTTDTELPWLRPLPDDLWVKYVWARSGDVVGAWFIVAPAKMRTTCSENQRATGE